MSVRLSLQEPELLWATRSRDPASGVAFDADPARAAWPGSLREGSGEEPALATPDLLSALPPSIGEECAAAYRAGRATVWTALALLLSTPTWATRAAPLSWTPASPRPEPLSRLVLAYGIGPDLHRDDPDALSRLAASLSAWQPLRGTLRYAQHAASAAGRGDEIADVQSADSNKFDTEQFACHSASWWAQRPAARTPDLRIRGGMVMACWGGAAPARPEDLAVRSAPPSPALCRLLPVWAVGRRPEHGAEHER